MLGKMDHRAGEAEWLARSQSSLCGMKIYPPASNCNTHPFKGDLKLSKWGKYDSSIEAKVIGEGVWQGECLLDKVFDFKVMELRGKCIYDFCNFCKTNLVF